jgi:4-hydroxybenzoate polyprenyltransferase
VSAPPEAATPPGDAAAPAGVGAQVLLFARALRPAQWTKNGVVLAGVIFSGTLTNPDAAIAAAVAFACFCAASGATYVVNDYLDRERDRLHPRKRFRPLASGRLNPKGALAAALALLAGAIAAGFLLPQLFAWSLILYVLTSALYSTLLKRVAVLDVLTIAAGFVLRALAGAAAVEVLVSPWLLVCTAFLALFLGFGKRRHELLKVGVAGTRPSLAGYSVPVLDQILSAITACTIMSYVLYTFLSGRTQWLMVTIPFVIYGIFRYLHLVHREDEGESPERTLLTDRPLQVCILLWVGAVLAVLYSGAAGGGS